ncbi:MAG: hypothetical protein KGI67_04520 [Pseudomonadota bacterium]|nr:hypothetical protein [Pseudomonadota bacterium]
MLIAGLLAIVSASPALAARQPLPPELDGLWRVADSACAGCDPSQGAETGAELRLAARGTRNPFGTDCDGALEVEAQADEPLAVVQERLGLPPRWLAGAGTAPARAWRLWCEGRPTETVILLANGALLLPGEASSVLHFQRVR